MRHTIRRAGHSTIFGVFPLSSTLSVVHWYLSLPPACTVPLLCCTVALHHWHVLPVRQVKRYISLSTASSDRSIRQEIASDEFCLLGRLSRRGKNTTLVMSLTASIDTTSLQLI